MYNIVRHFAKLAHFNYGQHGRDWQVKGGQRQSPIALARDKAVRSEAPVICFLSYNKRLVGPLKLINNGHTVTMPIPPAVDGCQPTVCGCKLRSLYKAVQLHFHWGSPNSKGAEHRINTLQYDAELHIVHQNCVYDSQKEAILGPDGFVVLAILLKVVQQPEIKTRALNKICKEVRHIKDSNTCFTFNSNCALRDILIGIERQEFFSYKGSLTTPPCAEVVNWFVYPKPINVAQDTLKNFWLLTDDHGKPLLNNFRALQKPHKRKVYYRCKRKRKSSEKQLNKVK